MAKNAQQVKHLKKNEAAVKNLRARHRELKGGGIQEHDSYITLTGKDHNDEVVLMHVCTGINPASDEAEGCGFYSPLAGPKPVDYFKKAANHPKCPRHGAMPVGS